MQSSYTPPSAVTPEALTRANTTEYAAFSRAQTSFSRFNDKLLPQQSNSREYSAVPYDVTPELAKLQSNYQRRVFNMRTESDANTASTQQQAWVGGPEAIGRHGVPKGCTSLTDCPQAEELVGGRIARSQIDEHIPAGLRAQTQVGTFGGAGRTSVPESEFIYSIDRIVRGAGPNRFTEASDADAPIVAVPRPRADYNRVVDSY